MIDLTYTPALIDKVKSLLVHENAASKLRIYVTGGGCSGFQYGFEFDEKTNEDDFTFEWDGINVIVDAISAQYLNGSTVDYVESMFDSHFSINNPNAISTCGCGSSFSV